MIAIRDWGRNVQETKTMSLEALRVTIPDYARDTRINLSAIVSETLLTEQQKWGAILAAAHATGFAPLIRAAAADAEGRLSAAAATAAKSAAALMAMTNVYYRALHAMKNAEYTTLRTGLRMNILADPGVDRGDFEFWSFVVSALNGCGACLDAHEEELRKRDWPATHVQAGLRIGAVMNAAAAVLRAETS
ncbi:MAG: alkyl hydroperoxide reductase subunit D [Alphaproteobacteria bacterium]|nr:MAG: alkyl hydroperoxide reductase subunit D [Caulobacteraceae bacterium]TPW07132.1 MAG: alkyl hydroperoxide reductase subunit D [Alphaproteobacteria bacterium]